jgi:hypothetical protein
MPDTLEINEDNIKEIMVAVLKEGLNWIQT